MFVYFVIWIYVEFLCSFIYYIFFRIFCILVYVCAYFDIPENRFLCITYITNVRHILRSSLYMPLQKLSSIKSNSETQNKRNKVEKKLLLAMDCDEEKINNHIWASFIIYKRTVRYEHDDDKKSFQTFAKKKLCGKNKPFLLLW